MLGGLEFGVDGVTSLQFFSHVPLPAYWHALQDLA